MNKKTIAIIALSALSSFLAVMLIIQVLAATYINLSLSGIINYNATEIGARLFGVSSISHGGGGTSINYITLNGSGVVDENGIYNESGHAMEFSNITANVVGNFTSSSDTMSIYIFIKNKGDRYIVPYINLNYDSNHLTVNKSVYYFDSSAGNIDPVAICENDTSASSLLNTVESATKNEFPINSYIDNMDTYYLRLDFAVASSPGDNFSSEFNLNLAIMADVQYDENNEHLLTVSQPINQLATAWTKVGYNANLVAQATKLETNSATALKVAYDGRDANGNTGNNHVIDDYTTAVVYKDIDIVNVDIKSGEVIGKLSDPNYDFEWYGGEVTLPSGTILASGRELTQTETFTVDCYTYYPDIYARRWMVGNTQYITISDQNFSGATKIDAYYTGTFESTIFNPDKTVATNSLGAIIVRSYSYWWTPLTYRAADYLHVNYGFGAISGSNNNPTQAQYLTWTNNLTTDWQNYLLTKPDMSSYINVNGVQGENYHVFIQNLLYLVKYADNNSQEKVGYGNTYTHPLYYASGVTITTPNGEITTGETETYTRLASERGSGAIGLKGTAGTSAGEGITFDNAGMAYADLCDNPMYSQDFLSYSTGDRRFMLDGYVGSDKYTSVWCLGICNPWGNIWTWVFGTAALHDESSARGWVYINFDYYDHSTSNYFTVNSSDSWEIKDAYLLEKNYSRLTYNVPISYKGYRYMGVSVVDSNNGIQSLIGLPTADSGINKGTSDGLSDSFWVAHSEARSCGMSHGGYAYLKGEAGTLAFTIHDALDSVAEILGFRSMLIN